MQNFSGEERAVTSVVAELAGADWEEFGWAGAMGSDSEAGWIERAWALMRADDVADIFSRRGLCVEFCFPPTFIKEN